MAKDYWSIKVDPAYRAKLKKLADGESRSMANMIKVLIDRAEKEAQS